MSLVLFFIFFFNDTATTEIYTLSLHDALPISLNPVAGHVRLLDDREQLILDKTFVLGGAARRHAHVGHHRQLDRKSTRLNSSHANISYAVFCLKKKKKTPIVIRSTMLSTTDGS